MTPESVIIILPIPPRVLSPNCAVATVRGRFAKAAAAKKQRRQAKKAIREERIETAPWREVSVRSEFFHATRRRRDQDNALITLKAAHDGIVDAGLVPDDTLEYMERILPVFSIDREHPRVVMTITRVR